LPPDSPEEPDVLEEPEEPDDLDESEEPCEELPSEPFDSCSSLPLPPL